MARIPDELKTGCVTLGEARAHGISRRELRGPAWRHVAYGKYRWAPQPIDEDLPLAILMESLPPGSALAGITAARLLGLDVPRPRRPEVIVPPLVGVSGRAQATVRRVVLAPGDLVLARGLPVTSPGRTCFDLAGGLPLVEGVVMVDMALQAGLLDLASWRSYVLAQVHRKGVAGARRALDHVEPKSESPMETRLRMLLVGAGLPRPEAQVPLYDAHAQFVGRPDLYYADARLGIEYDGENHRDRLISDNRRQNHLHEIGVMLLRYTAPDLLERPQAVASEVRQALARHRPCAGRWL